MFERFKEWYDHRHEYARDWKQRTGGKVLGYFCTYMPEELIYAAGVLPVRLLGAHETEDVTERHIVSMYCPFCRDVLAQGLQGRYEYLDGIALGQSCLHLRQSFHSWRLHVPVEFAYNLLVPHANQTPRAISYFRDELAEFKKGLEQWVGRNITEADIEEQVRLLNRNRQLMSRIYEFRKAEQPKLTGLEAMHMVLASQLIDKREHNQALEQVLAQLPDRQVGRQTGVRLIMIGSENDDVAFVEMVESTGATVVVDEHCTGTRYFWNSVDENETGAVLTRIAERYVKRPACPTKDWPQRSRFPHILQLAKEYRADAALLIQQKFCDPHELDIPPLRAELEAQGIKTYMFEFDTTVPVGQFKIRFEAFMEVLKAEELPF